MSTNEIIGAVLVALGTILGLFITVYKTFIKPNHDIREEYLRKESIKRAELLEAQLETNHQLDKLTTQIEALLENDNKQNDKIDKLFDTTGSLDERVRGVEFELGLGEFVKYREK